MFLFVSVAQIEPYNTRLVFNELVRERVLFRALGSTYNVHVTKGRSKTRMHGEQWEQFITKNNLSGGDILVFTMTPHPRISVAIMDDVYNEEDSGENSDSSDEDSYSSDEIDEDDRIIVSQRVRLKNHKKDRLVQLLP